MSTDAPHSLVAITRRFANREIRPLAHSFEVQNGIPRSLIEEMGRIGILGSILPAKYGGGEVDHLTYGLITEEIGKCCCSTRSVLTVHTSLVGQTINRFGSEKQKELWLPNICSGQTVAAFALSEPNVGSDVSAVEATYTKRDGKYYISGVKKWVTLGGIADLFIVIARSETMVSAFLVRNDSFTIESRPIGGLLGNRAAHVAEVHFNEAVAEAHELLGLEGAGISHIVNSAMDYGRYSIAWGGLAIAQESLERIVAYSRLRRQFGQLLCRFSSIQMIISDCTIKVHALRALCAEVAQHRTDRNNDAELKTIVAKIFASKVANDVANNAVQVFGGNGCYNEFSPERLFREAKILEIIEGTEQVLSQFVAEFSLQQYISE